MLRLLTGDEISILKIASPKRSQQTVLYGIKPASWYRVDVNRSSFGFLMFCFECGISNVPCLCFDMTVHVMLRLTDCFLMKRKKKLFLYHKVQTRRLP